MNLITAIFIGRSGCGKGTQADLLVEAIKKNDPNRHVLYVETGENFRNFLKQSSHSSQLSRDIYKRGELQPEFLAVRMWADALVTYMNGNEHVVLDGTPRKQREAMVLDSAFQFYSREKPFVIHLDVSEAWSRERLAGRGRADDVNEEEVAKRLAWFETDVKPAIEWYRTEAQGYTLLEINGERPIEDIHEDITQAIFGNK